MPRAVALMLKAIHARESLEAARRKATEVVARLCELRFAKAAELVETAVPETLAYYAYRTSRGGPPDYSANMGSR